MSIVAEGQPSRQGYVSAVVLCPVGGVPQAPGEVQPAWLSCTGLVQDRPEWSGARWVGSWLDCSFEYRRPGTSLRVYQMSAAIFVTRAGRIGRVYLRSCSCPDGLARIDRSGAERHCKHMVALGARLASSKSVKSSLLSVAWAQYDATYAQFVEQRAEAGL